MAGGGGGASIKPASELPSVCFPFTATELTKKPRGERALIQNLEKKQNFTGAPNVGKSAGEGQNAFTIRSISSQCPRRVAATSARWPAGNAHAAR